MASFFDGLCGAVVGVIAIVAAEMLQSGVRGVIFEEDESSVSAAMVEKAAQTGPAAVLYLVALGALYKFTNKFTPLLLVVVGAIAGQFIFVD